MRGLKIVLFFMKLPDCPRIVQTADQTVLHAGPIDFGEPESL